MIASESFSVVTPNLGDSFMLMPKTEDITIGPNNISSGSTPWQSFATGPLQYQQPIIRHEFVKKCDPSITSRRDYVAWSKRETEALVRWLDSQKNLSAMKRNTAKMLPQLAEYLQSQISGCSKTPKQCDHKIRNLKKCYKKVKEKLFRGGAASCFDKACRPLQDEILDAFPYFREFERIMREDHTIKTIPNALLKLAADGGLSRVKIRKAPVLGEKRDFSEAESASSNPIRSGVDLEFPDMSRFRTIRPKEEMCPIAPSLPTPESSSPPSGSYHKLNICPKSNLPTHHSSPAMSPDSQPEFKKQRVSSLPNFLSPYQMLNDSSMLFSEIEAPSKCPFQIDPNPIEDFKCSIELEPSSTAVLFDSPDGFGLVGTPNSDFSDAQEDLDLDPNSTLLDMLKVMNDNKTGTDPDASLPYLEEGKSPETTMIMSEHLKTALVRREAITRQKLYLNHLQSQIQRHTVRAELLFNNDQMDRAAKVMDKIDQLEQELHDALTRPIDQF